MPRPRAGPFDGAGLRLGGTVRKTLRPFHPRGALRGKGLTDEEIDAALDAAYAPDETGADPELDAARALAAGPYRAKLAAGRRDLVAAALARRGFPHRVIRQALDEAAEGEP